MITNANRSGSVRVGPRERQQTAPPDETRSGSASEHEIAEEHREFGHHRRKKIAEINGERVLIDAP